MPDGEGGDGRMNRLRCLFVETLSMIEGCSPPVPAFLFFGAIVVMFVWAMMKILAP